MSERHVDGGKGVADAGLFCARVFVHALSPINAQVASLQARLQQQGEQAEQQAMVSLEESRAMVHAAEKASWLIDVHSATDPLPVHGSHV